ncbi:MAG: DNA polymerase III subunit alpha [Clostridiales bacterium]|nr:DNA polymerase III subunit alpha [Clostridiales bacterium]
MNGKSGFVHLHTHTAYSLLDGQGTVRKVLDRAKELGMDSMAITDHGNMYGVIEFYEYAKQIGIKPILGCEVYVAARTRFDKVYEMDSERYHLILLAMNETGYKNLMKIVSFGFIDGFYYKPRVDMELLQKYNEGIIALSGCMFGVLSRKILAGNYDAAVKSAQEFINIFGRERYFVELQDHGLYDQKRLNAGLIKLARELELGLVCTNDIHYVTRDDAEYQDVLMCVQMGKTVDDDDRMKMESSELYVKSEEEMRELFSYVPEALENTVKIADRCNLEIEFGKLHLPEFEVPSGLTPYEYLRQLCIDGFKMRYPAEPLDENKDGGVYKRLCYELDTIKQMGYVDYFLIVRDFIRYAKDNGIMVGPGRGSAAGSVVSYCLEITNVDPIKYDLIFERFLNPERVSMPDIDVDFCYERRQEVIDYVNRKYGTDRVCQIITFGTMAARQAIRDVGRALNMSYAAVDEVAKQIPFSLHMTLNKAMVLNPKLKSMYDQSPDVKKLIDTARELEGLPRHASTHAAGVVITKEPVWNYVPLQKNDDVITTQFPMTTIERLGLLKMDFLGLRTLTVIRDAVDMAEKSHNIKIDINNLDMDDKTVYAMISKGDSDGVFQLESAGMKRFMTELKPSDLEDIIAGISLYRPGPMDSIPMYVANKNNPKLVTYKHPSLEPILNVTYGCIVYQEQVMQIVRELGGYSLGRADLVRRAMSKKKADVMAEEKHNFVYGIDDGDTHVDGAIKRGIDEETANSIFDEMMDFASYAFNKSHAAAYAVVAYQTAWLKCHYPAEFFAALLNSFIDSAERIAKYIVIVKKAGINVIPPDVNKSGAKFTVSDGSIVFGLGAVKNVGGGVVEEIVSERSRNGEFVSFTDFCTRTSGKKVNKRVIENLIRSGSFDSLGLKRSVLLSEYELLLEKITANAKNEVPGQMSMFDLVDADEIGSTGFAKHTEDNFQDKPEFPVEQLLAMEKESIGMYVSGHPLEKWREMQFSAGITNALSVIEDEEHVYEAGAQVSMLGIITSVRSRTTRNNELMKYIVLEDLTASIECIVFPSGVRQYDDLLKKDTKVFIRGDLDITDDNPPKVRVHSVQKLSEPTKARKRTDSRLYVRMKSGDKQGINILKQILAGAKGSMDVVIYYEDTKQQILAPDNMKVNQNDERIETLKSIFGSDNVKIVSKG